MPTQDINTNIKYTEISQEIKKQTYLQEHLQLCPRSDSHRREGTGGGGNAAQLRFWAGDFPNGESPGYFQCKKRGLGSIQE